MNLTTTQRFSHLTNQLFNNIRARSNSLYVGVIVLALAALEIFNFNTTDFALRDILGNHPVAGFVRDGYCGNREDPCISKRRIWQYEQLVPVGGMGTGSRNERRIDMVGN